jgi:hypothetical protein
MEGIPLPKDGSAILFKENNNNSWREFHYQKMEGILLPKDGSAIIIKGSNK